MKPSQAKFVILCKLNRIHSGWKFWTAPSGKKKQKHLAFFLSFFTNLTPKNVHIWSVRMQLYCCCNTMQHHPKCHQGVLYFYWSSCICENYKIIVTTLTLQSCRIVSERVVNHNTMQRFLEPSNSWMYYSNFVVALGFQIIPEKGQAVTVPMWWELLSRVIRIWYETQISSAEDFQTPTID